MSVIYFAKKFIVYNTVDTNMLIFYVLHFMNLYYVRSLLYNLRNQALNQRCPVLVGETN